MQTTWINNDQPIIELDIEKEVSAYDTGKDPSRTHTADSSSHDQGSRVGSRSTQGRSCFENQDTA